MRDEGARSNLPVVDFLATVADNLSNNYSTWNKFEILMKAFICLYLKQFACNDFQCKVSPLTAFVFMKQHFRRFN